MSFSSPRVVRLKRRKGIVVQGCDIYIGRGCTLGGWNLPSSKWANPYSISSSGSVEAAILKFKEYVSKNETLLESLYELDGKVLGCSCKPGPCHGDVLVQLFNEKYKH